MKVGRLIVFAVLTVIGSIGGIIASLYMLAMLRHTFMVKTSGDLGMVVLMVGLSIGALTGAAITDRISKR